jgi:hypothetical protein
MLLPHSDAHLPGCQLQEERVLLHWAVCICMSCLPSWRQTWRIDECTELAAHAAAHPQLRRSVLLQRWTPPDS